MSLRPSVNQLRRIGNFSQMFRWGIKIVKFPYLLQGRWGGTSQQFNIRATSASVPQKTGQSTEITIRGSKVRQPGIHDYQSPWTCNLKETTDIYAQQFLRDWFNLCWDTDLRVSTGNSSGLTAFHADLEGVIELYQLNNLDNPIYKYTLIGVYPEDMSRGDFDAESAEPMEPNISFALDMFTETPLNALSVYPTIWADGF